MSRFKTCVDYVLLAEGGHIRNPHDPGGETKYGISKRAYPTLDIKSLSHTDAEAIYLRDYWEPLRCDELPSGLDLLVFDAGVNQGPRTAIHLLQKSLDILVDGLIGPLTIKAAKDHMPDALRLYAAERALRYEMLANEQHFGRGWYRRLFKTYALALEAACA